MKSDSQLRILLLLKFLYEHSCEEHPVSVAEILQCWNEHGIHADRKSVYGDIAALAEFGIDIIQRRERQNRYFIGSRLFELPELKLLVDAVESSRFITRKKSAELIGKLSSLAGNGNATQLDRPVYMDGTAKPENEAAYYIVDVLQTAIREKRQVSFQYFEYTPQKKVLKHDGYSYQFSPYALIWSRDYYYAVGWSEKHAKIAQFRVDRMTSIRPMEQDAVFTPDFDPAAYVRQVFGMYGAAARRVELLCDNELMRSVIDRFGEDVQTEIVDEAHFRAYVEAAPNPPFFAWVFTFGGRIRITGPEDVLLEMRRMAGWLNP